MTRCRVVSQVGNVPKNINSEAVKTAFGPLGESKGIWAGHLSRHGFLIFVFYDLRITESAMRTLNARPRSLVVEHVEQSVQLRANFLSADHARKASSSSFFLPPYSSSLLPWLFFASAASGCMRGDFVVSGLECLHGVVERIYSALFGCRADICVTELPHSSTGTDICACIHSVAPALHLLERIPAPSLLCGADL